MPRGKKRSARSASALRTRSYGRRQRLVKLARRRRVKATGDGNDG